MFVASPLGMPHRRAKLIRISWKVSPLVPDVSVRMVSREDVNCFTQVLELRFRVVFSWKASPQGQIDKDLLESFTFVPSNADVSVVSRENGHCFTPERTVFF
ncbi:hypothetical protein PCAR4_290080 [Paraburkholderia caribensis]|nr:hypothetical protein PCAR4_290080 [Paraburkholderia caribensis]